MGNIKFYLIVITLAVICIGILWSVIEPCIFWTAKSETRIYCRLALIMGGVVTFGILRLYNAIMGLTKVNACKLEVEKRLTQSNINVEKQSKVLARELQRNSAVTERNTNK